MLRIKSNVDFKELEKYGFVYDKGYEWQGLKAYRLVWDNYTIEVVDDEDRWLMLQIFEPFAVITIVNILYDLIQAGLVEKVEE